MTPALRRLDDAELCDWLRLSRSEQIGPRTFRTLIQRCGSARDAIAALPRLANGAGGRAPALAPAADIETEWEAMRKAGLVLLPLCDPAYPPSLRAIDSAPPVLIVKGRVEILQRSMVSIVGSRNASAGMLIFTERLAAQLGAAGHIVVSGLARGIDAKAHLGSLATGTIGVLAGGHARIYPREHAGLVDRIADQGAVLSEMPLTWEPRGRDFPRRNRIVSGLSLGVVVVEAARRSGSLITARFAGEQGREVFAVPGSPLDPRSEGTNDLIKQGATVCTGWEDVADTIRPMADDAQPAFAMREAVGGDYWDELDAAGAAPVPDGEPARADDAEPSGRDARGRLAALLSAAPVTIDELVRLADMPAGAVQVILLDLEFEGRIVRHGSNAVSMTPLVSH